MAKRRVRSKAETLCVAFAWYDAEQWSVLKQVADDAAKLDESHEEWLRTAEKLERELRRKGMKIQRVDIKVEALVAWCQSQMKPINGESRSSYAAHLANSLQRK